MALHGWPWPGYQIHSWIPLDDPRYLVMSMEADGYELVTWRLTPVNGNRLVSVNVNGYLEYVWISAILIT